MQTLEQIDLAVEQLKKEVWYIAKVSVPALEKALGGLSLTGFAKLQQQVESNTTKISSLESDFADFQTLVESAQVAQNQRISANEASCQSNSNSINSMNGSLNSLSQSVQTLQNTISNHSDTLAEHETKITQNTTTCTSLSSAQDELNTWKASITSQLSQMQEQIAALSSGGSSGEKFDLIYDMSSTDPNINHGFTSGMIGGKNITFTKKDYKRIVVYASVYGEDAVATSYLNTRKATNLTFMTTGLLLNKIYFLKAVVTSTLDKLQVNQAASYVYDSTAKTLTYTREFANENYYVYRVEAYY